MQQAVNKRSRHLEQSNGKKKFVEGIEKVLWETKTQFRGGQTAARGGLGGKLLTRGAVY